MLKFTFVIPDMSWLYDYKAQFSLGILYVAAALNKCNVTVEMFDTNASPIDKIAHSDVFCFSAVFTTYVDCIKLAKEIKKLHPNSKVIIGGTSPTLESSSMDEVFDSIFIGQAEDSISEYVKDLQNNEVKRFYYQTSEVDINKYMPYREMLPLEYIKTGSVFSSGTSYKDGGSTSIMFSRGCPFNCAFCSSVKFYNRRVNFRSIDSISKEIDHIREQYGIQQFRVQDDTFTVNKKFLRELAVMLKEKDIYYRCSTRIDVVDEEVAQLLYDSGCREIGIGIEVANNGVLEKIQKGITIEEAKVSIKILQKFPFKLRQFFMIGLPFDSEETVQDNINFIEETKPDSVIVGRFIPFPGCDMFNYMEKFNIKSVHENTVMNIGRHLDLKPNITRTDINEEEHENIMRKFYNYLIDKNFL